MWIRLILLLFGAILVSCEVSSPQPEKLSHPDAEIIRVKRNDAAEQPKAKVVQTLEHPKPKVVKAAIKDKIATQQKAQKRAIWRRRRPKRRNRRARWAARPPSWKRGGRRLGLRAVRRLSVRGCGKGQSVHVPGHGKIMVAGSRGRLSLQSVCMGKGGRKGGLKLKSVCLGVDGDGKTRPMQFVRYYGRLRRLFPQGQGRSFHYYFYHRKRRLAVFPSGRHFVLLRSRFGNRRLRIVRKYVGGNNTSVCCASIRRYVRRVLGQRCRKKKRPRRRYRPRRWSKIYRNRRRRYLRRIQRRKNRRLRYLRWRRRRQRRIRDRLKKIKRKYGKRSPRIIGGPGSIPNFLKRSKLISRRSYKPRKSKQNRRKRKWRRRKRPRRVIQYKTKKGRWTTIRYIRSRVFKAIYKYHWKTVKLTKGILRVDMGKKGKPKWIIVKGAILRYRFGKQGRRFFIKTRRSGKKGKKTRWYAKVGRRPFPIRIVGKGIIVPRQFRKRWNRAKRGLLSKKHLRRLGRNKRRLRNIKRRIKRYRRGLKKRRYRRRRLIMMRRRRRRLRRQRRRNRRRRLRRKRKYKQSRRSRYRRGRRRRQRRNRSIRKTPIIIRAKNRWRKLYYSKTSHRYYFSIKRKTTYLRFRNGVPVYRIRRHVTVVNVRRYVRVVVQRKIRTVKVIRHAWYIRYGRKYRRCVLRRGRFLMHRSKRWIRVNRKIRRILPRRVRRRRWNRRFRRRRRRALQRRRYRQSAKRRRRRARRQRRRSRYRRQLRRKRIQLIRLRKRLRRIRISRRSRPRITRLRIFWVKRWYRIVRRGRRYYIRYLRKYLRVLFRRAVPHIRYKKRWIRRAGKLFGIRTRRGIKIVVIRKNRWWITYRKKLCRVLFRGVRTRILYKRRYIRLGRRRRRRKTTPRLQVLLLHRWRWLRPYQRSWRVRVGKRSYKFRLIKKVVVQIKKGKKWATVKGRIIFRVKKSRRTYIITKTVIRKKALFVTVYRRRTVRFILGRRRLYFKSLTTRKRWRIRRARIRRKKFLRIRRKYVSLKRNRQKRRRKIRRRRRRSRRQRRIRRRRRNRKRRRRHRRPRRRPFTNTRTQVYIGRGWRRIVYTRRRYLVFIGKKSRLIRFLRTRVEYRYHKRWVKVNIRRFRLIRGRKIYRTKVFNKRICVFVKRRYRPLRLLKGRPYLKIRRRYKRFDSLARIRRRKRRYLNKRRRAKRARRRSRRRVRLSRRRNNRSRRNRRRQRRRRARILRLKRLRYRRLRLRRPVMCYRSPGGSWHRIYRLRRRLVTRYHRVTRTVIIKKKTIILIRRVGRRITRRVIRNVTYSVRYGRRLGIAVVKGKKWIVRFGRKKIIYKIKKARLSVLRPFRRSLRQLRRWWRISIQGRQRPFQKRNRRRRRHARRRLIRRKRRRRRRVRRYGRRKNRRWRRKVKRRSRRIKRRRRAIRRRRVRRYRRRFRRYRRYRRTGGTNTKLSLYFMRRYHRILARRNRLYVLIKRQTRRVLITKRSVLLYYRKKRPVRIRKIRLRFKRRLYRLSRKPLLWKIRFPINKKKIYRKIIVRRARVLVRIGKKRYISIRNITKRRRSIRRIKRRIRRRKRSRKNIRRLRRRRRRRKRRSHRRRRRKRRRRRRLRGRRFHRRHGRRRQPRRRRDHRVRRAKPKRRFRVKKPSRQKPIFNIRIGRHWSRIVESRKTWYFHSKRIRINRKGVFHKEGRIYKKYPKFLLRVRFPGDRKWYHLRRSGKGMFFRYMRKLLYFTIRGTTFTFKKKYRKIGRRFLQKRYIRSKVRKARRVIRRKRRRLNRRRRRLYNRNKRRINRRRRRIRRLRRRIRQTRRRHRRSPRVVRGRRIIRRTALRYHFRFVVYYSIVRHYYYSRISSRKTVYFKIRGSKIIKKVRPKLWKHINPRAFQLRLNNRLYPLKRLHHRLAFTKKRRTIALKIKKGKVRKYTKRKWKRIRSRKHGRHRLSKRRKRLRNRRRRRRRRRRTRRRTRIVIRRRRRRQRRKSRRKIKRRPRRRKRIRGIRTNIKFYIRHRWVSIRYNVRHYFYYRTIRKGRIIRKVPRYVLFRRKTIYRRYGRQWKSVAVNRFAKRYGRHLRRFKVTKKGYGIKLPKFKKPVILNIRRGRATLLFSRRRGFRRFRGRRKKRRRTLRSNRRRGLRRKYKLRRRTRYRKPRPSRRHGRIRKYKKYRGHRRKGLSRKIGRRGRRGKRVRRRHSLRHRRRVIRRRKRRRDRRIKRNLRRAYRQRRHIGRKPRRHRNRPGSRIRRQFRTGGLQLRFKRRWRIISVFRRYLRIRVARTYLQVKQRGHDILFKYHKVWKPLRRPRIRFWRKGWRRVIRKRFGRRRRFVLPYRGRIKIVRITSKGVLVYTHKKWRGVSIKRPYRRRRIRLVRTLRRRARRLSRRIKTRVFKRKVKTKQRKRRRRKPYDKVLKKRPRITRCGLRVRVNRKWRPVIRYKKRFWIRYHLRRTRVSFRKTTFRIYYKGRWRKRPSYRRIKVLVNKKYRYVKKTTRKGIRTWITRCYKRSRRIRFRYGHRIIKTKTTWTRITSHVQMRVRISGKIYPAVRRGRQWYLRDKKKLRMLLLRGSGLLVRFKKNWKKLPGNPLQVWHGKYWRTVTNCCKILRLRVRGRSRRISLRGGGLRVKYGGRNLRLGQIRRRIRHARRKYRKRRRSLRKPYPQRLKIKHFYRNLRRQRKSGKLRRVLGQKKRRRHRRRWGRKSAIPKTKADVNEPIHPAN